MTAAAHALPGQLRAWPALTSDERREGVAALQRAVADVASRTGRDQRELDVVATAHAHELVSDGAGWRLRVEHPRFVDLGDVPLVDRFGSTIVDDERAVMFCEGETRLHALADALTLLAGPDSPELELGRRRAQIADKRRREAETREARDRAAHAREAERATFEARNRRRIDLWRGLQPEQQRLHVLADRFPQHAEMLRAWGELLGRSPKLALDLPDGFAPELTD